MKQAIKKIPWVMVIALCATLGLAPFSPPHVVEKLAMLVNGNLTRPVDMFDFALHGIPWILLVLKIIVASREGGTTSDS